MALQEIRTFLNIQDAIIDRAKIEDTTGNRDQLKEKINTKYQEIVYADPYTWSGDTRPLLLPAKYATGTVTATNASDIVTGASTVWTENAHRYLKMSISGSNLPYKILRVASNTSITLEQQWRNTTAASLGYYIYQDEFGLFPDCQDVRVFWIPGLLGRRQPLPIGPTEMDAFRSRMPLSGGVPKFYTVWGSSHYRSKTWDEFNIDTDFWEDSFDDQPRNKSLVIWPAVRQQDYWGMVRYTKVAYPMNEDTEEPMIPVENRAVLVYGVLLEHFLQNRDIPTKREWEDQYKRYKSMMAADIETYDDELILKYDTRPHLWSSSRAFLDDDDSSESRQ